MSDGWSEQETGTKQLQPHHFLAPKFPGKPVKCGHLNEFDQQLGPAFKVGNFLWSLPKVTVCLVLKVRVPLNSIPGPNKSPVVELGLEGWKQMGIP